MIKKTFKIIGFSLLCFIAFILLYFVSAWGLSRISSSSEIEINQDVSIYILSNGVHTDLVMPLKNDQIDWSKYFKISNVKKPDSAAQYLSIGWGDKGFYLHTPQWSDLKFSTAFNAAFALSSSAVHTTLYNTVQENEQCKRITISKKQYEDLVNYVKNSIDFDNKGLPVFIPTNAVYGENDAFYEAKGSYHLFHTCNTWANNGLKSCKQKAAFWTPFESGIFYHYR